MFAGTPAVAVPTLERLHASDHEVVGVVTRPPAPLGRKRVLTPSPVAEAAARLGIPVIDAARLDTEATERIAALRPDLGVVVAYGGLVREPLLSTPAHGWINLHFSALPAWRGAAPVQRAIIAGDAELGASVFRLVPELDAGDVYASRTRPLDPGETAGAALESLAATEAGLVLEVVDAIAAGTAIATPQAGEPSFAPKLGIEDGRIDWTRSTAEIDARIRGVTPEPGAHTEVDGTRLKVLDAAPAPDAAEAPRLGPGELRLDRKRLLAGTADGAMELRRVQPAGRSAMPAADWWRGLGVERADAR
ncbi:methionyl-tRNA formyltransferase [Agromyces kandeliae]|uniref:methionyl-tRNA formyltransferase n=1 Tax=Agromyces kandeliae TaxID=2666141 RepID=UPI002D21CFBB|nr:methionyl-tRNA formyltransferase [Agromyces kandeliae]